MKKQLWIEKYAPKSLEQVVNHREVKRLLKKLFIEESLTPPILLYGPPGVGKTALAHALLKEIFKEQVERKVKEVICILDRGIDSMRQLYWQCDAEEYEALLLEKLEALTFDAQEMLRYLMDSNKVKIILATSQDISSVIEPLRSRFIILRLKKLSTEEISKVLKDIANREKIEIDSQVLSKIAEISEGDLRKAINVLQLIHEGKLAIHDIYDIITVDVRDVKPLYEALTSLEFEECLSLISELLERGFSAADIIVGLYTFIKESKVLSSEVKMQLLRHLAEAEYRAIIGVNQKLVLASLASDLILCIKSKV